jgi:hypothetical protein
VTLVVLSACGSSSSSTPPPVPTPPASSPSTSTEPSPTPDESPSSSEDGTPQLLRFKGKDGVGAEIAKPSDIDQIAGTSDEFQAFVLDLLDQLQADAKKDQCEGAYVGVGVQRYRTDGYAMGSANECGGAAVLWGVVDGSWQQLIASQDVWDCAVLEKYQVPSSVAGHKCWSEASNGVEKYNQE